MVNVCLVFVVDIVLVLVLVCNCVGILLSWLLFDLIVVLLMFVVVVIVNWFVLV